MAFDSAKYRFLSCSGYSWSRHDRKDDSFPLKIRGYRDSPTRTNTKRDKEKGRKNEKEREREKGGGETSAFCIRRPEIRACVHAL